MNDEAAQPDERRHDPEPTNERTDRTADEQPAQPSASGQPDGESVEATSAEPSEDVEALQQELDEKDRRLQETIARLQRLQADFENYKKRVARERDEQIRRAENEMLLEIVPVYDGFERAFQAYQDDGDPDAFVEGMERVFAQFRDVLADHDVHPIDAEGQAFDPSRHEALMSTETDDHPPNTVVEAFERGYARGETVLRPSRVMVSRPPTTNTEPDTEPTEPDSEASESQSDQDEGGTD
jgi:molecular chaperone GrpE